VEVVVISSTDVVVDSSDEVVVASAVEVVVTSSVDVVVEPSVVVVDEEAAASEEVVASTVEVDEVCSIDVELEAASIALDVVSTMEVVEEISPTEVDVISLAVVVAELVASTDEVEVNASTVDEVMSSLAVVEAVEEDNPSTEDVVVLISSLEVTPSVAVLVTSASVVVALDGIESEEVVRSDDVVEVMSSTVVEVKDVSTAGNDVVSAADVEATSLAVCVVVVEPITILIPLSTLLSSSRPGTVS
jgi:hypothetical protein